MGAFSGQLFENVTCKACNIKTNAYAEDAEIKLENNESRIIQIRLDTHNSRMPRIECTKSQNIVNARVTYEFSGQGAYAVEVI